MRYRSVGRRRIAIIRSDRTSSKFIIGAGGARDTYYVPLRQRGGLSAHAVPINMRCRRRRRRTLGTQYSYLNNIYVHTLVYVCENVYTIIMCVRLSITLSEFFFVFAAPPPSPVTYQSSTFFLPSSYLRLSPLSSYDSMITARIII